MDEIFVWLISDVLIVADLCKKLDGYVYAKHPSSEKDGQHYRYHREEGDEYYDYDLFHVIHDIVLWLSGYLLVK